MLPTNDLSGCSQRHWCGCLVAELPISIGASQPYPSPPSCISYSSHYNCCSPPVRPHALMPVVILTFLEIWFFTGSARHYRALGTILSTISNRHDGCEDGDGPLESCGSSVSLSAWSWSFYFHFLKPTIKPANRMEIFDCTQKPTARGPRQASFRSLSAAGV